MPSYGRAFEQGVEIVNEGESMLGDVGKPEGLKSVEMYLLSRQRKSSDSFRLENADL